MVFFFLVSLLFKKYFQVRSQDGGKLSFSVESILAPRKSGDLIEKILIDDDESGQILITLCKFQSKNQSNFHSPISVAAMKVYTLTCLLICLIVKIKLRIKRI